MRIIRIEIEEFGKLRDQLFLLGEGLNVVQGANESGKSTLLAFIRFVLYGFPRKSGADGEERERRLSWHGQRAAGRILLSTEKGEFCIARRVTRQGSAARESFGEVLSVTALASGEEVALDGRTPGEYFLGLPAALYDSTLCLRQSDAARVSEPGVGEAVNELLFTGSMGVSADAAMEKLRLARRELQHQKGRGGQIVQLADRITATEDALLHARQDSAALAALRTDAERYRAQLKERRAEMEQISALFEQCAIAETLSHFERAREAEALFAQKRADYEALRGTHAPLEHAPDAILAARGALREREAAKAECARMLPELTRLREVKHNDRMLAANAILVQKGGAECVLADFQGAQKKRRRARRAAWILAAFTLVFATVVALIATGVLAPLLQALVPVGDYLPLICMIGGTATLGLLTVTLLCTLRATRFGQRVRGWMKRLGLREAQMFRTYLEQCAAETQSAEAHRLLLCETESVYTEKQGAVLRAEARAREALDGVGVSAPADLDELPAILADLEARYRTAYDALVAARSECERAGAARDALAKLLEGKNESELRARFVGEGMERPEDLRRKQTFLKETLAELERKYAEIERREIALATTVGDPFEIENQLAALRGQHGQATRRLAALELALCAMEQGVRALGEGLLPKVCEKASAHLDALTRGAYRTLYAAADLSICLDSDKGPLPLSHFSAACRDAAHLSLRLGLLDTLVEERLPLLFDEAFSRLDDDRAFALLQVLLEYCRTGGQCVLFTCHGREAAFLAGKEFTHFELQ